MTSSPARPALRELWEGEIPVRSPMGLNLADPRA